MAGAAASIIFVATKLRQTRQTRVCSDKTRLFVATKLCQYTFCREKCFVATNIIWSRQTYICLENIEEEEEEEIEEEQKEGKNEVKGRGEMGYAFQF